MAGVQLFTTLVVAVAVSTLTNATTAIPSSPRFLDVVARDAVARLLAQHAVSKRVPLLSINQELRALSRMLLQSKHREELEDQELMRQIGKRSPVDPARLPSNRDDVLRGDVTSDSAEYLPGECQWCADKDRPVPGSPLVLVDLLRNRFQEV